MELMIIGIDGMEPSLYEEWKDELPNLKSIEEEGGFERLESTYIPLSAPAWASFMTGKNPGNHGIIDFVELQEDYSVKPLSGKDLDDRKLHQMISEEYKVGTVNMPYSYPPEPLNGFNVSGMTAPGTDADFAYPEDLQKELREDDYRIEWTEVFEEGREERSIKDIENILDKRSEAFRKVLRRDPEVFMGVFSISDRVQHWFWKHMDETHEMHRERHEPYSDTIKNVYKRIDRELGDLIEEEDPENIIVLSDHGFGPIEKGLNINQWLMEKGYLSVKRSPLSLAKYAGFKAGLTLENVYSFVQKLGLSRYTKKSSEETRGKLLKLFLGFEDIDWDRSKAFSVGNFGPIYLNDSRWSQPGIDESEKEEMRESIIEDLKTLEHNDEVVIDSIVKGEEVFEGDGKIPDIVFRTKDMRYMTCRYFEFGSDEVITSTPARGLNGHHRPEGVLFASGSDIDSPSEGSIEDLAPTIMHLLDMEIPADMDGEVLDIFSEDSEQARREPRYIESDLEGIDF